MWAVAQSHLQKVHKYRAGVFIARQREPLSQRPRQPGPAAAAGQPAYPSTFPGGPPSALIRAEKFLPAGLATLSWSSVGLHWPLTAA